MFGRWRRKRDALRSLEDDIRQHIADETQDNIARGMSPCDARSAAMRRFGNVALTKEDTRDVWARVWLEQAIRDVRLAIRGLVKKPLFVAVAATTIALAIGAATVVFSIVNSVLLRPLPYQDPDEIALLLGGTGLEDASSIVVDDLMRYQDQTTTLEGLAFYSSTSPASPDSDVPVATAAVDAAVFDVLGVRPVIGSVFPRLEVSTLEEDSQASDMVLLSYGYWQTRFGGDPDIVGQTIRLHSRPHEIVGVMPQGFFFPAHDVRIWRRLSVYLSPPGLPFGLSFPPSYRAVARLKADTPLATAQAEIDVISRRRDGATAPLADPPTDRLDDQHSATLHPIHDVVVNNYRAVLWTLMGAVGLVLLIACANVANLLLAQGVARGGELSLRTALGAGRMGLIRQLVTETLLVSLLAGTLGIGLAFVGLPFVLNLGLVEIPRLETASISAAVLVFAVAASVFAALLAGLAPAWKASRPVLSEWLNPVTHVSATIRGSRVRNVLVAGEIAMALVLLIGAGLLVRSAIGLSRIDWGFDANDLGVVAVLPGEGLHPVRSSRADQNQFATSVLERVESIPGIQAAGVGNMAPLVPTSATIGERVVADGRPLTTAVTASRAVVSGSYLRALGMAVRGRVFDERDDALGPKVAILSESLARAVFPGTEPIGQTVHFATLKESTIDLQRRGISVFDMIGVGGSGNIGDFEVTGRTAHTVIGVVEDVRTSSDPTAARSSPTAYLDYRQHDRSLGPGIQGAVAGRSFGARIGNPDLLHVFVVRAAGDTQVAIEATKQAILEIRSNLSFQEAVAMEQLVSRATGGAGQSRLLLVLSTAFGVLALMLAAAGVYGVVSNRVAQRTYEIGVRLAIGARPFHIVGLVCGQGLALTCAGLALGLGAAVAGSRLLESSVFGITTTDAFTFAGVTMLLALSALAASLIPAIRATKVDPAVTTREA